MADKQMPSEWFANYAFAEHTPIPGYAPGTNSWYKIPIVVTIATAAGDSIYVPICYLPAESRVMNYEMIVNAEASANTDGTLGMSASADYEGVDDTDASSITGGSKFDADGLLTTVALDTAGPVDDLKGTYKGDEVLKMQEGARLVFLCISGYTEGDELDITLYMKVDCPPVD